MINKPPSVLSLVLGSIGIALGAAVGCALFVWMLRQGFYALAAPGALIGLGCGLASGCRSLPLAVASAVTALVVGLMAEWASFPFVTDASFSFFVAHLHQLRPVTLFMLALGVVFAGWFGYGRERFTRRMDRTGQSSS